MDASDYTSVLAQNAIRQITEPAVLTNLTSIVAVTSPTIMTEVEPPPNSVNFVQEIHSMLYAFGDSRRPKLETAILVDDIVRQQLVEILCRAIDASHRRGAGGLVGIEDVIYLLRRSPVKIQRFVKYFSIKDMATQLVSQQAGSQTPLAISDKKGARRCREFIRAIDVEGGLLFQALNDDIHDQVRINRLKRLDRFSRNLDERRYVEFTRARQVSFLGQNLRFSAKFKEWVLRGVKATAGEGGNPTFTESSKIRMDQSGLEALAYLAYESVGHIVDMALLVRHDQDVTCKLDPVMRIMAPVSFNTQYPTVQMPQMNKDGDDPSVCSSKGNGKEDHLLWTQPLEPHHILEAVRRLTQRPNSFLGWYGRPENRNQSTSMPLIAI